MATGVVTPESQATPELEPLLDPELLPELEPLLEPELLPELEPLLEPELLPELDPEPLPESAPPEPDPELLPESTPVPDPDPDPPPELLLESRLASITMPQSHTKKPVPVALHTWPPTHPAGPVQGADWPGAQIIAESAGASDTDASLPGDRLALEPPHAAA